MIWFNKMKKGLGKITNKPKREPFNSREIENIWYTKRMLTSMANKLGVFENEMRGKKFNADYVMITNYEEEIKSLQKLLKEQKKILIKLKKHHTYNPYR